MGPWYSGNTSRLQREAGSSILPGSTEIKNIKMKLGQSLEQRTGLSQEQRLENRLVLDQKLVSMMDGMEEAFPPAAQQAGILRNLIEKSLSGIENEQVRKAASGIFSRTDFVEFISGKIENLAAGDSLEIERAAIDYIYKDQKGSFELSPEEATPENPDKKLVTNLSSGDIWNAYQNPDGVKEDIKQKTEILRTSKETNTRGLSEEIERLKNSLLVLEAGRAQFKTIADLFKLLLATKIEGTNENIQDFIEETSFLKRFKLFESERLVKRFTRRCEDVRKTSRPDQFKAEFMNTMGEFLLISFGVISKNMFTLRKGGEIDEDMMGHFKQIIEDSGGDFKKIAKRYDLSTKAGFFYQRWSAIDRKPSASTDIAVRRFLFKTVRKDEKELLSAADFDSIAEEVKNVKTNITNKEDRADEFEAIFERLFSNPEFMDVLVKHAGSWHKELETFFSE